MLHITNGDSVGNSLILGPLPGDVIAWRDVLHDGPVPAGLSLAELSRVRARFIHACGWTDSLEATLEGFADRDKALAEALDQDEIVLWFEHDLYDQLQLLQILDWFAQQQLGRTRLSLISREEYLGTLNTRTLASRFPSRESVTAEQLSNARAAWQAFRSEAPTAITAFLQHNDGALPFVAAAFRRHLEQFPSVGRGLSRSEYQALRAFDGDPTTIAATFLLSQEQDEPAAFLGDASFAWYLSILGSGPSPLLRFVDGAEITLPTNPDDGASFWQREGKLTEFGRRVLHGEADRIATTGIDRWLGGVHLQSPDGVWRWDARTQALVPPRK